jgi:hypothetical protein
MVELRDAARRLGIEPLAHSIAFRAVAATASGDEVVAIVRAAERLRDEVIGRQRVRKIAFGAAVRTPRLLVDDFARELLPLAAVASFRRLRTNACALLRSLAAWAS